MVKVSRAARGTVTEHFRLPTFDFKDMADDLTLDEIRALAADIGLTRLTDQHLQQLHKATRIARARRASLPLSSLVPADEPSHVYRLPRS